MIGPGGSDFLGREKHVKTSAIIGFFAGGALAAVTFVSGVNAMQGDPAPVSQQGDLYKYADE